jgi:hypothetical protein
VTLHELKRYDEAIFNYDKALSLKPDYYEVWSNKGVTLHELKRYDEAIAHYDKALSLKPDYAEGWINKASLNLFLKKYQAGWKNYDWRLNAKDFHLKMAIEGLVLWNGSNCKRLLIFSEQGVGDIIFYADGGCEFNAIRNKQMPRMFRAVSFDKMICSSTQHRENEWCKMDLIVELGMNEPNYLHSVQFQASSIIIEVCDKTRQFIKEWYELCCIYHFIDDTPSVIPNCANFIEHRHDQSVFSLLFKKYELPFNTTVLNTIIIARNRSGTPMRNMHSNKITFL